MYGETQNFRITSNGCGGFTKQVIGFSKGNAPSVAVCDLSLLYRTKTQKEK
nr:hypothetical protein [Candidatus Enterousia merdequi]